MRGDDLRGNDLSDLILANIHDMIAAYLYGGDKVPSILKELIGEPSRTDAEEQSDSFIVFESADAFDEARNRIIGGQTWPEQN